MSEPFIFVSYRRSDTAPYALALKAELEHRLKSAFVFVDVQRIRATERWPDVVNDALLRARTLIVLIGTCWVECEGAAQEPRLFDEGDWVRREIAHFLEHRPDSIVPVLVEGATMTSPASLPPDIAPLTEITCSQLTSLSWHEGVDSLARILAEKFSFKLSDSNVRNPGPNAFMKLTVKSVGGDVLEEALSQYLRSWRVENRYDRTGYGATSQWLVKEFSFPTFEDAIRFMRKGADECEKMNHHPTWENCFKDVVVRLSTWNAGHRVTHLDLKLARCLDRVASGS
jgi:pterin-4a-carbinolamine dehydratase